MEGRSDRRSDSETGSLCMMRDMSSVRVREEDEEGEKNDAQPRESPSVSE